MERSRSPRNVIAAGVSPDYVSWRHKFNSAEKEALRALAESAKVADQRRCLDYLWAAPGPNRRFILEIADRLIPRRSHRVRWGTFHLLGRFCETHPQELWPLVVRWGSVPSQDIRRGIACFILEHILEYHFQEYFEKGKQVVEGGNRRFRYTLRSCWKLGQAEEPENGAAFDALVHSELHTRPGVQGSDLCREGS